MKDALAGVGAGVDDDTKTALGDALFARQLRRGLKDLTDQRAILIANIGYPGQVFARNEQNMHRRPGRNVFERDDIFVLKNNLRFHFAFGDGAEQAVTHGLVRRMLLSGARSIVVRDARQTRVNLTIVNDNR